MLHLIGRNKELFIEDIQKHEKEIQRIVMDLRFLVIDSAGFIEHAVTNKSLNV